ncbi:MAG: hypothetical protein ABSB19_15500 [Methylomonas sp.]|jgi:hypothetical protein
MSFRKVFLILAFLGIGLTDVHADQESKPRCRIVAKGDAYEISSDDGKLAWSVKPKSVSPYLQIVDDLHPDAGVIALGPDCRWVALAGGADYHYVWLLSQNGKKKSFKTVGTPETLTFNTRGDRLAFGTGAGHFYLADPHGRLLWRQQSFGIFTQLQYIDNDKLIMAAFNGGGALFADKGRALWRSGNMDVNLTGVESNIEASPDYRWFRIETSYFRGATGYEWILVSKTGKERWREKYWTYSSDEIPNLKNAKPLGANEKSNGFYTEHWVNNKLAERVAWYQCVDDSGPEPEGEEVFQKMMQSVNKIAGTNKNDLGGSGCPHILYRSNKLKEPPAEFFQFGSQS